MVQPGPRLRNKSSRNDLYLPHACGIDDAEYKTSTKKLEKRLRFWFFRLGSSENQREIPLFVLVVIIGLLVAVWFCFSGVSRLLFSSSHYPWRSMSRPARVAKPRFPSKIYTVPGSVSVLGDKSDFYAQLRKAYDARFPSEAKRSVEAVGSLQKFDLGAFHSTDLIDERSYYDIYNCPDIPPVGYPFSWRLLDLLNHWPTDDPEPRAQIFQSLCVFEYAKDLHKARRYRDAELPFVVRGDPEVARTVERWNTPYYLEALLGKVEHDTAYSVTNHFRYWTEEGAKPSDWKQPTQKMHMTYHEWLHRANVSDVKLGPTMPHWYFRVSAYREGRRGGHISSDHLFDELPFFQPRQDSLYVKDQNWQRGIFCRFGMKGVIAENHFDGALFFGERNFLTVLSGERRYILSHPNQCSKMRLYPMENPSARFSPIDWSDPDLEAYPEFAAARGNEVVLQPGDSIYIPSFWFHHIISLSMNVQCNTRSGLSLVHAAPLDECGYTVA